MKVFWVLLTAVLFYPRAARASDTNPNTPAAASKISAYREKNFAAFWKRTHQELEKIPLDARLDTVQSQSDEKVRCSKAAYSSLKHIRIHAWYCRPASGGPFPAVLINPWYGEERVDPPKDLARRGLAVLWYQARGFDVDQSSYPVENHGYILSGIETPETYVYREIVSHALRGLDFLASRPEVDPKRIGTGGASQGGGLTLILAGLDSRVSFASADFPFLSDFADSVPIADGPFGDIRSYLEKNPNKKISVWRTLSYFDALNIADHIRIPIFVQAGLRDTTCPARGIEKVFRRIPGTLKELRLYPTASHSDQNAIRWKNMTDFLAEHLLSK